MLAKPSRHRLYSWCTNVVPMPRSTSRSENPRPHFKCGASLTHYRAASSSSPSSNPDVLDQCWRAGKVTNPPHNALLIVRGFACTERRDEVAPGHHQHHTVMVANASTPQRNSNPGMARAPQDAVGEVLTSTVSISRRKRRLTDSRASCGHSWNQSMATQLTMAGNLLLRTRSLLPTGEKHSATCGVQGRRR